MSYIVKRGFSTNNLHKTLSLQRVVELKQIATSSGLVSSGKKSDLVHRLVTHFDTLEPTCSSVLSIDLGYRNLAYCHIDQNATILDWARVDLDLPSFHPSAIAPVVRRFIKDKVTRNLKLADTVLIEQQRARSAGAHAVLEHTLRVNCVEAVLWTGLYEMADLVNRPQLKMTPILRQAVDRVWQSELDAVLQENPQRFKTIKAGYYHKKQVGTLLVQKWLDTQTVVTCSDTLKAMYQAEKKKDDLSDCLIQALAWYKWDKFSKSYIQNFIDNNHDNKEAQL